jgi:multicomponent Na+:H+ antiporter subunit D
VNPLWTLLPPLAVIPFILFFGEKRKNWREGSIIVAGLALLLINNLIYSDLMAGNVPQSGEFSLLANYSLKLSAEPMGVLFGLLASFLWVVTTVYSIGYMRGHHEVNQTRFYTCFAIALAAVMGAAYADNLLTLFVAYEVITISTYPLVTHAGGEAARRAGRVYLGILMTTSIGLLLPDVIWTTTASGSMDFVPGGVLKDSGISCVAGIICLWYCQSGFDAFSSLAASGHGCANSGQRFAARCCRSQDRCIQYLENCCVHLWYRYCDGKRSCLLVVALCRLYRHRSLYCGFYQG